MRDPKRIRPILNQLAALWATNPDLRLGQLILNAAKEISEGRRLMMDDEITETQAAQFSDIYEVEDEELIKRICEYMKKGG